MGYLVHVLKNIRSSDLEQALLVLPFHTVVRLVRLFCKLCERGTDVELVGKSLLFLFRAHQPRLMATQTLSQELATIAALLRENLSAYRQLMGTNLAALRFVQRVTEDRRQGQAAFQSDVLDAAPEGAGKRKKGGKRSKSADIAGQKRSKL
jgi:U3 small nucleolar RNA-associated protein 12